MNEHFKIIIRLHYLNAIRDIHLVSSFESVNAFHFVKLQEKETRKVKRMKHAQ